MKWIKKTDAEGQGWGIALMKKSITFAIIFESK